MEGHCKLVHGCMMSTESVPRWQQFHMAPALQQPNSAVSIPLGWILKMCYKSLQSLIQNHTWQECSESAREQRTALHKGDQQKQRQRDHLPTWRLRWLPWVVWMGGWPQRSGTAQHKPSSEWKSCISIVHLARNKLAAISRYACTMRWDLVSSHVGLTY